MLFWSFYSLHGGVDWDQIDTLLPFAISWYSYFLLVQQIRLIQWWWFSCSFAQDSPRFPPFRSTIVSYQSWPNSSVLHRLQFFEGFTGVFVSIVYRLCVWGGRDM